MDERTLGFKIGDSKVLESRESPDGTTIRRRRITEDGQRFTTYERVEMPELMVRKRSGSREAFDRDKVMVAVRRSVGKFLEGDLVVEEVVARAVHEVYGLGKEEVSSQEIGEAILAVLAEMNEVAYVRFASVFREFQTLDEFERIIREQNGRRNGENDARQDGRSSDEVQAVQDSSRRDSKDNIVKVKRKESK